MSANIANIVFPGEFNPKRDKWQDYKERFFCALDAAGVNWEEDNLNNRARARSMFLSQCGKETFSLIASLLVPRRPTEVPLADILEILDRFYGPEVNEIIQAGKFHKRVQLQTETIQDFVGEIGLLASKCNFTDLNRQLRDRLVLGVRDERLRRDLLKAVDRSRDLSYQAALQTCLNYQESFQDLYSEGESTKNQTQTEQMEIGRVGSGKKCRRCAKIHDNKPCPFLKARCYACNLFGHIGAACENKANKKQNHHVEEQEEETEHPEDMMGIFSCGKKNPIKAEVMLNGVKTLMEVDSGASRSLISQETYKRLWTVPPPIQPSNLNLITWTKQPLKVNGTIKVSVVLGDKEALGELVVVEGAGPSLLGRDWFDSLNIGVVGLCWTTEEIKSEFPELFESGLGEYKGPAVSLHLRSGATPKFLKARPVPFPMKQQVEEELKRLMWAGVLTPVRYSEWATPLRIVQKDNGSLRICGDYRSTVNAVIETDKYPLPTSSEAFVKLSGGCIFSKLDLKQAYTQLKVDEATANMLTLNTSMGLMKMNRLAFGVSAAPAIFQRVMSSALAGMDGVACLLDDIAIAGKNKVEHDSRLRAVVQKLQEMGLRLNIEKCVFGADSITFLGHKIDGNGLHPSPAKVAEIKEKSAPTNKETLRAFLGLYNFYEKFLPNKSTVLEPLYRLLEAGRRWSWGENEEKAFRKAKELLSSDLTLVGYDLQKELLLVCDSSEYGVGAILTHIIDKTERPVSMASRTLQPHERKYGQIDKEALAIIFGLTKFHEFLVGRRFTIVTDHKPLVGLFNPAKPIPDQISPRMLRWSLKLACYDYQIEYRPGKQIGNADALSRWTAADTTMMVEDSLPEVLLLLESSEWHIDALKIAEETKKDQLLSKVIFLTQHGWPPKNTDPNLQPFWTRRDALSLDKDCLLWSNRVVIPEKLRKEVLKLLHGPHAGIVQTKAYARGYVWWPEMDQQIENIVSACEDCQAVRNNPPKDPQTWITADKAWSRVHIDFAGPFMGKTFLVLIDSYSKWFEAEIVPSMNSATVITVLRKIFVAQGLPEVLVSDNGKAFTSEEFNAFLQKNEITHLYSPPYHPQTNGQIERAIQTFKNKIKKFSGCSNTISWNDIIPRILYSMRTVPNSSNKTPTELLNGRRYRTAVSVLHPACMDNRANKQRQAAAEQPPARRFAVNQSVLARMYGPGEKWEKATVEVVEGPAAYRVRTEDGELHRRHADQLLPRPVLQSNPNCDSAVPQQLNNPDSDSNSDSYSDTSIVIPDPSLWPDIIGV